MSLGGAGPSSFWDLHVAIQDSMGWLDYHLHEFRALDPRSGTVMKLGIPDGEGWDHELLIADWMEFPLDYTVGNPALLAALADPEHPEHDEYLEWAGGPIDPAMFAATSVRFDDPAKRWRIAFEGAGD